MFKFTYDKNEADNITTFYIPQTHALVEKILKDPDIEYIILTGKIDTAKLFNDADYGKNISTAISLLHRLESLLADQTYTQKQVLEETERAYRAGCNRRPDGVYTEDFFEHLKSRGLAKDVD